MVNHDLFYGKVNFGSMGIWLGKAEIFHFSVAIVLKGKEVKLTSLHMNARGQGHLLTFAKVTWVKNILSIFFKKYNKA